MKTAFAGEIIFPQTVSTQDNHTTADTTNSETMHDMGTHGMQSISQHMQYMDLQLVLYGLPHQPMG